MAVIKTSNRNGTIVTRSRFQADLCHQLSPATSDDDGPLLLTIHVLYDVMQPVRIASHADDLLGPGVTVLLLTISLPVFS